MPRNIPGAASRTKEAISQLPRSCAPDQARHPPAFTIPAMREEPRRIRERAPLPAAHVIHSERAESPARERDEVSLPLPAGVRRERIQRNGISRDKHTLHLIPHFEMLARDP